MPKHVEIMLKKNTMRGNFMENSWVIYLLLPEEDDVPMCFQILENLPKLSQVNFDLHTSIFDSGIFFFHC